MNLILLCEKVTHLNIAYDDSRAKHVRTILKLGIGQTFDVGVVNGSRGKARIISDGPDGMKWDIEWGKNPPLPYPITLIIGLPRPQTARKILQESTSLGVNAIWFFQSDKGEASYKHSRLWITGEWLRHLHLGAEQAFTTHLPEVRHYDSLKECIINLSVNSDRIALDNYEADLPLGSHKIHHPASAIAIGSERGWSAMERDQLRFAEFNFYHLGQRVLRAETACVAAISINVSKIETSHLRTKQR